MIPLTHPKKPCAECPWRLDVAPGRFGVDRFRALAATAYDMNVRVFSCHKSAEDRPTICAGFLLRGADHNLTVRMAYARGELVPGAVQDGGYPLVEDYREMAVRNGVEPNDPALEGCR